MSSIVLRLRIVWLLLLLLVAVGLSARIGSSHTLKSPATSCTGEQFADVCPGDWFYQYVTDLSSLGAISGYGDGTFHPNSTITRGQVMKVIVISMALTSEPPATPTFEDVTTTQAFYAWIETGAANNVISGYSCGGPGEPCDTQRRPYFRPTANGNRGQLAKMVVNAMRWPQYTPTTPTFHDVPSTNPYYGYVERANLNNVVTGYACSSTGEPCP